MNSSEILADIRSVQTNLTIGILLVLALWESFAPFITFSIRRAGPRFVHIIRNFLMGSINLFLQRLIFLGAWIWVTTWATKNQFGLLNLTELPVWAHAAGAILLLDVWTYWWHRMNHEIYFFWRFHQVHHSDPEMDFSTSYRFHFGEMALSSLLRIPLLALFGIELWQMVLFDVILFANVQFHHANIGLPWKLDKPFRLFFTSPEMHKVHHSRNPAELNSNYTAFLSIWDRLFGTFKISEKPAEIEFGVDGYLEKEEQTFTSLLTCPARLHSDAYQHEK